MNSQQSNNKKEQVIWEEKNSIEAYSKSENNPISAPNDIIKETKKELEKKECENTGKKWAKNCPECNSIQTYGTKKSLDAALKSNTICKKCPQPSRKAIKPPEGWIKICEICNHIDEYPTQSALHTALKRKKICNKCNRLTGKRWTRKCPNCNSDMDYLCHARFVMGIKGNKKCKKCNLILKKSSLQKPTLTKNCPKCGDIMKYREIGNLNRSIRDNCQCKKCYAASLKLQVPENGWIKNCPDCGKIQKYSCKKSLLTAMEKNVRCNKCRGIICRISIPTVGWIKNCPGCGKKQKYSCKSSLDIAIRTNRKCLKCSIEPIKPPNGISWERTCSGCGKIMTYDSRASYKVCCRNNSMCRKCGITKSMAERDLSWMRDMGYREKMSVACTGKRHSDKTKEKLRIIKLEQIKRLGTQHNYNPDACRFIDEFRNRLGYNFKHVMNGGEVMISGYLVDGYDKINNIVFEYDEPKHNILCHKKKDRVREKNIIEAIHPSKFIRYNEQDNTLRDIISGEDIKL